MKVYIVGNELVNEDSLPIRLLPVLRKAFPRSSFIEVDPNENFVPEEGSIIIDTVEGINDVRWFTSIDDFVLTKSVTVHDYDLGFHLRFLEKLGKITRVHILGLPIYGKKEQIEKEVLSALSSLKIKEKITVI